MIVGGLGPLHQVRVVGRCTTSAQATAGLIAMMIHRVNETGNAVAGAVIVQDGAAVQRAKGVVAR